MPSKVAIRRCGAYNREEVRQAVAAAVAAAVDFPALARGKRVLIKVNILSDAPPEKAVCTHPEVVRALIGVCQAAGAAAILVADMPGMDLTDEPERALERSGMAAICRDEGVDIAPFSRNGFRETPVPRARRLPSLMFANDVLDADVVINAPKLKSHLQALYTGAIKNWFGTISSRDRRRAHHLNEIEPFSEALVDIFRVRPPDLTVMDAVIGMEGRGPGQGKQKQLGVILASTDAVALDATALECVNWTRMKVPHVRIAGEEGLGEADVARIEFDGPTPAEVRVPFEPPPRAFGSPPNFLVRIFFRVWRIRPQILVDQCKLCGACRRMCPVGAISLGPEAAAINRDLCIECFCCHESCPHNAIGERMSVVYRAVRWFTRRFLT
jgi:uncharacterized protein (DUF362 family)/NAD-dependent dihydropyrimidine dehydrogenase PreA subunit